MSVDSIPIWVLFIGTVLIVLAAIYLGLRLGSSAHWRSEDEKEAPTSGVSGAVLGLTAFMLVFTFSIVSDRYATRMGLVREDANAIRTTYLRTSFLPEPDRAETRALLSTYLDLRLKFVQANGIEPIGAMQAETDRIQRRLRDIAGAKAERDMNSEVAAL